MPMRRFLLYRHRDKTGISGTGVVVEGVQFSTGCCAITWIGDKSSMTFHTSLENVIEVHGHDGDTQVVWIDKETEVSST